MSAPTAAEVREAIAALRRDLDGKTIGTCSPADVALSGALAYAEREALPLAEHRDALAAEVARLRKLFVDAGEGTYDVLALVDHYQADAVRMSAEVARLREALEIACDWWGGCEHHPDDCPGVANECKAAKRVNELAAKGVAR